MAGAGYKLFNTGDVLTAAQVNTYLMEQTVMVFANAAARTTALSGVVSEGMISYLKDTNAVEVYDGSNWVSSDDPNAIQNTIVDAKGDLIAASAADTPARLAVGNNGETLVADSSATTGLRWQGSQSGGKNGVINGGFDIWQRGTSGFTSASIYTADRWYSDSQTYRTISRQTTGDTTNLPFLQYCARVQRNSGQTGTTVIGLSYSSETSESLRFAGRTVTLSFYARAGANFSASSNIITVAGLSGTGTDQLRSFTAGYTGEAKFIDNQTATLTTTWQRFSYTGTIASTATEWAIQIYYAPTGTAGANDFFELTGVQLEVGSVATQFSRAGGTLAGELAACQRYYYRLGGAATYETLASGFWTSTSAGQMFVTTKSTMRTNSPAVEFSTLRAYVQKAGGLAVQTISNVVLSQAANGNFYNLSVTANGTDMESGRPGFIDTNNSTSGYLALSSEL